MDTRHLSHKFGNYEVAKMMTTCSSANNHPKMVTTPSSDKNNPKKGGRQQSPIPVEVMVTSEPNTDTTQPLATPAKALMVKEIWEQLKGVRQLKFGETKKGVMRSGETSYGEN